MRPRLILSIVLTISIIDFSYSQKLTIAFTRISSLEKGAKVYVEHRQVGYVTDIQPNRDIDTLFVSIKITGDIKIPKGSSFSLDENLLGPSQINIEYSNEKEVINSKEILLGTFRPLKSMTPFQIDSAKLDLKRLKSPTIDTLRN